MKIIDKQAAQGDILITHTRSVPKTATPIDATEGRHVLVHSETGHDHWIAADGVMLWQDPQNALVCYLRIAGPYGDVIHARPFDTHEPVRLRRGTYEIRRQREMTPEGWRRVED